MFTSRRAERRVTSFASNCNEERERKREGDQRKGGESSVIPFFSLAAAVAASFAKTIALGARNNWTQISSAVITFPA